MNDEQPAPKTTQLASITTRLVEPDLVVAAEVPAPEILDGVWSIPYAEYPPVVDELIATAYEDDWVRRNLDWTTWLTTTEAQSLVNDAGAVEQATTEQLARLLTAIVRQERFTDGAILGALKSGLLQRIARRIRSLDRMATKGIQ